jgi:arabinose-5-phosphate isomerase
MTRSPKRIGLDAGVTEALRLMRKYAIDELPVVDDDDRLVGLIDVQDLIARGFSVFDTA